MRPPMLNAFPKFHLEMFKNVIVIAFFSILPFAWGRGKNYPALAHSRHVADHNDKVW